MLKALHQKFLQLEVKKFMRYLKYHHRKFYYDLMYINATSNETNITTQSIYDYLFIRTYCRQCWKKTKFDLKSKCYYSFCSLRCKSKWYKRHSTKNFHIRKEDLTVIRQGKRFRRNNQEAYKKMQSLYYTEYKKAKNMAKTHGVFVNPKEYDARKLFLFLFGRKKIRFCKFCGVPTKWNKDKRQYYEYCSHKCSNGDLRHKN